MDKSNLPFGLMQLTSDDQEKSEMSIQPCFLALSPRVTRYAFRYGGIPNSRQLYTYLPNFLSKRCVKERILFNLFNLKIYFSVQKLRAHLYFMCFIRIINFIYYIIFTGACGFVCIFHA